MNRLLSKLRDRLWPRVGISGASLLRACTVVLVLALVATITGWALEFSARRTPSEPVRPVATGDSAPRTQAADVAPVAFLFHVFRGRLLAVRDERVLAWDDPLPFVFGGVWEVGRRLAGFGGHAVRPPAPAPAR